MLKNLFSSKKFVAAFIAVVVAVLAEFGLDIDPQTLMTILSPLMVYIVGQGIADHGKEKAKIETGQE